MMSLDDGSNDDKTEEIGDFENDSDAHEIHAPEVPKKQKFVVIDELTASKILTVYHHKSKIFSTMLMQKEPLL